MTILAILFGLIIVAAGTYISGAFLYPYIEPYLKTASNRKLVIRNVVVFASVAWGGAALIWYLNRGPAYFEQGIDQLHNSKYIQDKVGDFNSYSYYPEKWVKAPTTRAVFQVTINTDSLNLFLTCTMNQVDDKWKLVNIKEDSVRKSKP